MSYTQSDPTAQVIAAQGTTIHLIDGRAVTLRYSMASVMRLEQAFGSLTGLQTAVQDAVRGLEAGQRAAADDYPDTDEGRAARDADRAQADTGKLFTVITAAIAPGLLHERVLDPDTGRPVRLGADRDVCAEWLDPARFQTEYFDAFQQAFAQAFGATDTDQGAGGANPPAPVQSAPSPGLTGITSPSSSAAAPTPRSGA